MEKDVLAHLREGNLIIYPTDTLPGLGCNACNEEAVNRINTLKKREHKEGLICLIPTTDWLVKYVVEPPSVAFDLMTFSNRPLTIVFDEGKNLAKGVYGTDGSVALRLVRDKFCHPLLLKLGKPIVSTSANFTGEKAPQTLSEVDEKLRQSVEYVAEESNTKLAPKKHSQIIRLKSNGEFIVIRK